MFHRPSPRACKPFLDVWARNDATKIALRRWVHLDHRVRLQNQYDPSGGVTDQDRKANEDAHEKLLRAGYLRQAHAGVFHLLPLGYRVQDKIMKLIEKHMQSIGASRLALATLSSPSVWGKSGRFEKIKSELFLLQDRKDKPMLLSPTHEEEITFLVRQTLMSHKQLPARLYQITPKFRDEVRPRKGLLRGREFMMKDLYTFDASVNNALETYTQVRAAYDRLFSELRLPIVVAEASSGDIGGDVSHEYHLPTSEGEDDVISCTSCEYRANSEVAESRLPETGSQLPSSEPRVWRAITKNRKTLVNVWYPSSHDVEIPGSASSNARFEDVVNFHAVKRLFPDLDANVENVDVAWWDSVLANCGKAGSTPVAGASKMSVVHLIDGRLSGSENETKLRDALELSSLPFAKEAYSKLVTPKPTTVSHDEKGEPLNLLKIRDGDLCPKCNSNTLSILKATELGHTFHLGDRYSDPLLLTVKLPDTLKANKETRNADEDNPIYSFSSKRPNEINVQMGCHGIGVSRIMGAMAEHFADSRGLNWPRVVAPYEVAVLTNKQLALEDAEEVYDLLTGQKRGEGADAAMPPAVEVILDDREKSLPWKLKDADLVGYPVIVVLGRAWGESRKCEVQCRQLDFKELVALDDLQAVVNKLLEQL